jgi:hypothetical protein
MSYAKFGAIVLHEVMKQLDAVRQEVGNLRREVSALKEQR